MKQLHKKFTDCQVKDLMERYLKKEVERKDLQKVLLTRRAEYHGLARG